MYRAVLLAVPLLSIPAIAVPAAAAAGPGAEQYASGEPCEQQNQRNRRRGRGIGGVLGGIAGSLTPFGGAAGAVTSLLPVGELLGEAIAALLDCNEQQKAARATEDVVRRDARVGTTSTWTSETRANVSGSSTLTAAEPTMRDGSQCVTVTDIVIIDGEETRAPKRMCRRPPNNRYVRV